jgi:hypothetical protein
MRFQIVSSAYRSGGSLQSSPVFDRNTACLQAIRRSAADTATFFNFVTRQIVYYTSVPLRGPEQKTPQKVYS